MAEFGAFAITFLLALGIAIVTTPVMIYLGKRFGIVTRVTARRVNEGDTRSLSKLGGGVLFISFTLTILLAQLLPVPRFDPHEPTRLIGLLLGSCVILVVGFIDDKIELSSRVLLLTQLVAAGIAIHFEIFIEGFNNPISGTLTAPWPFAVTVILTLLWIMGMM
ncbi:MAG: hypothetical protein K8J31_02295, partial [Anaerolineae bacterium]|nr:hypothetical protein [Anaerolineae bacterium]